MQRDVPLVDPQTLLSRTLGKIEALQRLNP